MNPPLTEELRAHLVDMWVRVTNEGGSVGFVPPVTGDDIRPTADRSFDRVRQGSDVLICLVAPDREKNRESVRNGAGFPSTESAQNDIPVVPGTDSDNRLSTGLSGPLTGERVVAWLLLAESESLLRRHWRTVYRVQVDPEWQGLGLGTSLMAAAAAYAKEALGLEALTLMTRSGTGAERFYKRCGYREVGRIPGAIRVGPNDDRDELHFWLDL
ncbi:Acetyltransferase (GNAT) family protein [Cryptosporangium aurantiacum]|uniref:Acetyltransferase (GNAT) family protein n=1 Tax=Cryptosporangium aurantiacum TaxID=134849 RepID=A0A1M7RL86_9ACTN|nr:Acetyltransferase (GNAT) family protein [Cryptosporangium aurantiacum]